MILPVLPVKNVVLFPHVFAPVAVGRPPSVAAVDAALSAEGKSLIVAAQRDADVEDPEPHELYSIATRGVIKKAFRSDDQVQLVIQGLERVAIASYPQTRPFLKAQADARPVGDGITEETEALQRELLRRVEEIQTLLGVREPDVGEILGQVRDPVGKIYLLASIIGLDVAKEQAVLEADSLEQAMRLMHSYLIHEEQIARLRRTISLKAAREMSKDRREYVLRQQLRAIQKELGEENAGEAELELLRGRLKEAALPDAIRAEAETQLNRLARLPAIAPDYQVIRSHLELILELPWKKSTADNLDLARARRILDEDHFDLKEVKQRIIEHLAVLKLNPKAKAPILCFVGPPGTGKTSLGQSIARALERKFERMSLGGMHDEAELRGHRRTYVGAMPGRLIQAIRRAGVDNPLLMLDEVDKLGRDFRGDPAAALMEVLDPAQNFSFRDNYLDLPFDLSSVFFITTANALDTIPAPLLDRMELLRLSGYTEEEKLEIARRYLTPRQLSQAGLTPEQLRVEPEAVRRVIRRYTREAGLRQLERSLASIARKVALRFAQGPSGPSPAAAPGAPIAPPETHTTSPVVPGGDRPQAPGTAAAENAPAAAPGAPIAPGTAAAENAPAAVLVREEDLAELLGPERFFSGETRRRLRPGVSAGLAWTEAGGEVIYVEATLLPGREGLTMTGSLGDVMKESVQTALGYVWSRLEDLAPPDKRRAKAGIHVHVPSGAVPKDGPSAGVAITVALASLYAGVAARADTAMTGEVTLTGLVLPVGGIKEKALAARRGGLRRILLPKANEKDLAELDEDFRRELEVVLVENVDEALAAAIPGLAPPRAQRPDGRHVASISPS